MMDYDNDDDHQPPGSPFSKRQRREEDEAIDESKYHVSQGSDVLTLNTGGKDTVQTLRGTLTCVPGSVLAERCSDLSLPKGEEGIFFIDREPEIFLLLAKYLRNLSRS